MRKQRTHYGKAFKENAVKLSLDRKNVSNLAQELGMSGKGNCWDNAVAESFFKFFKTGLIYGTKLTAKEQMRLDIFEYIESRYNHKRRFSALGNLAIDKFWKQYNIKKQLIKDVA